MHSYAIRLKFNAYNYVMDCEALLAGLAASTNQGMKDLHVFVNSLTLVPTHTPPKIFEPKSRSVNRIGNYKAGIPQPGVSVGIKTRPSVKEVRSSKKGKAASNAPRVEPNYNHEASGSN
ncbi:hypothetical protein Tco_0507491 [Tanacetum coccineum]